MYSDRRSFLRLGSILVCGSLLRPQSLFAFEKTAGVLSFDATEMRLLDFIASYSSVVRVVGASVLGHFQPDSGCGMRVLVSVNDFREVALAVARAPFQKIFVNGNVLTFSSLGSAYLIENLSPGEFAARVGELGAKEKVAFAHDALTYDPVAKSLDDPFAALKAGELKLINRPTKTPEALEIAMRGTGDARAAELPEGETFAKWKAQLVRSKAHSKAAQPIASAFVRSLPEFAALAETEDVKSALSTPLVSSALKSALGLSARSAIAEFDRLRAIFGQSYRDSAVWLFAVLQKQFQTNARDWIRASLPHEVHWREAFSSACQIEQALKSPGLKSQT